jgi:hypothetical protein
MMRITQDLLYKFARETVKQRQRSEPDLHAAYLCGSVLSESPLLGGVTDIDLVLVHKYQTPVDRETVGVTNDVSLDIVHKRQEDFNQPRSLRQDPWMGYPLTHNHILLFDTDHWLEFVQSSVSADFHRPDNVLSRVNHFLNEAREQWFSLIQTPSETHTAWLHRYLEILALAANAISGLIGPPLTTRRFLTSFNQRTLTLGVPNLITGFLGLLGFSDQERGSLARWAEGLDADFNHLLEVAVPPVHLTACRQPYYLEGVKALMENETPNQALWPLLRIWTDLHLSMPEPSPGLEVWQDCLNSLNLTEDQSSNKGTALDAYLDTLEVNIESWAEAYGI